MNIIVTKDSVSIANENLVHKGEYKANTCLFVFSAEYTKDMVKMAVFTDLNDNSYQVVIGTDNTCDIPNEILAKMQNILIGVYAYSEEDGELVLRYSPSPTSYYVSSGSYDPNAQDSERVTPTECEQYYQLMQKLLLDADVKVGDLADLTTTAKETVVDAINEINENKQENLTAGENITIEGNVISATDTTYGEATTSASGLMSANDKAKIDEIETGAEANTITDIKINGISQVITDKSVDLSIPTKISDLTNDSGFIDNTVNNLVNYELKTNTGSVIELSINSDYVMTLNLKNSAGTTISTQNIDLPLETMVVGASYSNVTKNITLTLQNGNTTSFSVADLVSGLQTEITSNNKLSSDLVDDTTSTNKFVTSAEKTAWNNKQNALTAGNNITIENNVISASGGSDLPIYHFHSTINLNVNWNTDEQTVALPSSDYAIMAGIIQDAYSKNLTNFLIYLTTNMSNRSPMLFTSERSSEMITSKPSSITMYALTSTLNNRMNSKNPMLNNFQLWIQLTWSGDAPTITSIEMIGVKARCLTPTSTYNYTPSADYNPATKKYVDDSIAAAITTTLGGNY